MSPNKTIREHRATLDKIYASVNENRSWEYIYGYLSRSIGYLSKEIVLGRATPISFIRPLSWLFALSTKLNQDPADFFLRRFPGKCPYCLTSPCRCLETAKRPAVGTAAYRVKEDLLFAYHQVKSTQSAVSFASAMKIINEVYPNNLIIWKFAGPWHHLTKMQEEVAEVHEAISSSKRGERQSEAIGEEIADVLAWLVGACHLARPDIDLDEEFTTYYYDGCPVCKAAVCRCSAYGSRATGLVNIAALGELVAAVRALETAIPAERSSLGEVRASLEKAFSTQNEPTAFQALKETLQLMERLGQGPSGDAQVHVAQVRAKAVSALATTG